jgi:hypothetical protein
MRLTAVPSCERGRVQCGGSGREWQSGPCWGHIIYTTRIRIWCFRNYEIMSSQHADIQVANGIPGGFAGRMRLRFDHNVWDGGVPSVFQSETPVPQNGTYQVRVPRCPTRVPGKRRIGPVGDLPIKRMSHDGTCVGHG